jgi:hypothetical protein
MAVVRGVLVVSETFVRTEVPEGPVVSVGLQRAAGLEWPAGPE